VSEKLLVCELQRLTEAFRKFAHLQANIDPLGLFPTLPVAELELNKYSLKEDTEISEKVLSALGFSAWSKYVGQPSLWSSPSPSSSSSESASSLSTVRDFHQLLRKLYCGAFSAEYSHINNAEEREWLSNQLENAESGFNQSARNSNKDERLLILKQLLHSELFDHFMQKRFSGVKRYGLEGGEMMISGVSSIMGSSSSLGVESIVIGMPHRGRLNLLTSLLHFPIDLLFHKIQGNSEFPEDCLVSGDVLSHLAQSVDVNEYAHPLHVSLLHNPSHLELVNPVTLGKVRSKQRIHSSGPSQDNTHQNEFQVEERTEIERKQWL